MYDVSIVLINKLDRFDRNFFNTQNPTVIH